MNKISFLKIGKARIALGAVIVGALTGFVAHPEAAHASVTVTVAPNTFEAQDDYVYYPGYNVYYSKHHHKYAYLQNNTWVSAPTPPNVSVDVLHNAPSVNMDFHDSPANHHADIVQKYPKNWAPAHTNHESNDHKDDNGDRAR
jgi:hypothetical protein